MPTANRRSAPSDRLDDAVDPELDFRALTEYMCVLEDGDERSRDAPDLYTVTSESGAQYLVDVRLPACECPDFRYRSRLCKHLRRVLFAVGQRAVPTWIDADEIDPQLGIHVGSGRFETVGERRHDPGPQRKSGGVGGGRCR